MKSALTATAAGGAMLFALGTVPAQATIVIDGITIPTGATISTTTIFENVITGTGQGLNGVGIIDSIKDNSANVTYTYGQGGLYLTIAFDGAAANGFKSSFVLPPTATDAGYVEFTGGFAGIYLHTSAPSILGNGPTQNVLNASTANGGVLWLGGTPQLFGTNTQVQTAGGPASTTLEAIISNNNTLASFTSASGSAFFDATSGDAAAAFHTCSFAGGPLAGAPCPVGKVDMTFTESFNTGTTGDFQVSGSGTLKSLAVNVPEPATLSLLGAGLFLLGFGALRRKASKV